MSTCVYIIVLIGCASAVNVINFDPIDDAIGLMFEHVATLRHVTDQRFVFVKTIDYYPLLQELENISKFLHDPRNDATSCPLVKIVKPGKLRSTLERISKYLSVLTQLNNEYVSYAVDFDSSGNNKVFTDIEFEYVDSRQQSVDDERNPPHWSAFSADDAKALLKSPVRDRVKILPAISTATNTMSSYGTGNRSCLYLAYIHSMMNRKLAAAAHFVNTLDSLIQQTSLNKLNATNNMIDDNVLFDEMRQLVKMLAGYNLSWVVDFEREMNSRFDLSQAYKLYLYADKNVVGLYITMPLVNTKDLKYNLYRVATVPFCRGTMCLMMVPATSYIAVTDTRNYYTRVPDDYNLQCKKFTGYNEILCPFSPRIATMESDVCEIEIFMGRYVDNIDEVCDVRVADNAANQVFLDTLVDRHKWLYAFSSNATVGYLCTDQYRDVVVNVSAGVGLMTARPMINCSVRVNKGAIMFSVDTRIDVPASRSYWPRRRFDYNDYVDVSLLRQTSTRFADTINDLSVQQLKTLRSRFHIRDYTTPPKIFFSPRNNVHEPEQAQDNKTTIMIVSLPVVVSVIVIFCILAVCYFVKRYCIKRKDTIKVLFKNEDQQSIAGVQIDMPNNYEKTFMFPMEVKRTKNSFV